MKRLQRIYYTLNILFWFSTALMMPVYVLVLQRSIGLNLAQIGTVMAVMSVAIFIFEFPSGVIADWLGRKYTYMWANIIIAAAMLLLFLSNSFVSVIAGMFLFGTGRAIASGSLEAWFIDSVHELDPEADIQPYLAKAGFFTLTALAVRNVIGGLLAQGTVLQIGEDALRTPIFFDMAIKLLVTILTLVLVRETVPPGTPGERYQQLKQNMKGFFTQVKRNRSLAWLFPLFGVMALGMSSLEYYWQPNFTTLYNLEGREILLGLIVAGCMLFAAAGSLLSVPLGKLFGGRHQITAGISHFIYGLAILAMGIWNLGIIPLAGIILAYGVQGVADAPYSTLLNSQLKKEYRSSGISAASFTSYAGGLLAGALGAVAQGFSIPAVWIITGSAVLCTSWIVIKLFPLQTEALEIEGEVETEKSI